MEKISSIVPRSRRVAAADLSAGPAVRPGTPGFGRPVGSSTVGVKDAMTTAQRAVAEHNRMTEGRKHSAITPDIVSEMSEKFFLQKTISAPNLAPPTVVAPSVPDATPSEEMQAAATEDVREDILDVQSEPREYVPPGTYLDVTV
ncbi:MAG: hypothetical protein AB7N80_00395 [Bdellovibrionales bacterium]